MTRTELNSVRELHKKICGLEENLRAWKVCAENIVPVLDGLPKSQFIKSRVERITTAIIDTEQQITKLREQLNETKLTLATQIFREFKEPMLQTLLILRYVECLSYKEVSRRMGLSLRHTYRLHENFLKKALPSTIAAKNQD